MSLFGRNRERGITRLKFRHRLREDTVFYEAITLLAEFGDFLIQLIAVALLPGLQVPFNVAFLLRVPPVDCIGDIWLTYISIALLSLAGFLDLHSDDMMMLRRSGAPSRRLRVLAVFGSYAATFGALVGMVSLACVNLAPVPMVVHIIYSVVLLMGAFFRLVYLIVVRFAAIAAINQRSNNYTNYCMDYITPLLERMDECLYGMK